MISLSSFIDSKEVAEDDSNVVGEGMENKSNSCGSSSFRSCDKSPNSNSGNNINTDNSVFPVVHADTLNESNLVDHESTLGNQESNLADQESTLGNQESSLDDDDDDDDDDNIADFHDPIDLLFSDVQSVSSLPHHQTANGGGSEKKKRVSFTSQSLKRKYSQSLCSPISAGINCSSGGYTAVKRPSLTFQQSASAAIHGISHRKSRKYVYIFPSNSIDQDPNTAPSDEKEIQGSVNSDSIKAGLVEGEEKRSSSTKESVILRSSQRLHHPWFLSSRSTKTSQLNWEVTTKNNSSLDDKENLHGQKLRKFHISRGLVKENPTSSSSRISSSFLSPSHSSSSRTATASLPIMNNSSKLAYHSSPLFSTPALDCIFHVNHPSHQNSPTSCPNLSFGVRPSSVRFSLVFDQGKEKAGPLDEDETSIVLESSVTETEPSGLESFQEETVNENLGDTLQNDDNVRGEQQIKIPFLQFPRHQAPDNGDSLSSLLENDPELSSLFACSSHLPSDTAYGEAVAATFDGNGTDAASIDQNEGLKVGASNCWNEWFDLGDTE